MNSPPVQKYRLTILFTLVFACLIYAKSDMLDIKHADINENSMINGELVSVFRGKVHAVITADGISVRADLVRIYRNQGLVEFSGNVSFEREVQKFAADYMKFTKSTNIFEATSRVVFTDSKDKIRISGNRAWYDVKKKLCFLEQQPLVVKADPVRAETLTIKSIQMQYNDSTKILTANDSVSIHKGSLLSKSKNAYYFSKGEKAWLRGTPRIAYDKQKLSGDSVNLYFRKDTLDAIVVIGTARGHYTEENKLDTSATSLFGDSMYVSMRDTGSLDSIWVVGKVKSTYSLMKDTAQPNQVMGKQMILAFDGESLLNKAKLWGNATSVYYIEDTKSAGRNDASGDTLSVWFLDGKAQRLRIQGGVRGKFFPQ